MTDRQREETRAYSVSVTFRSGHEPYAAQAFEIVASDEFDAERLARDRAAESVYHDVRIPDLSLDVNVEAIEPTDPDEDPPPPPIGASPIAVRLPASAPRDLPYYLNSQPVSPLPQGRGACPNPIICRRGVNCCPHLTIVTQWEFKNVSTAV